MDNTSIMAIVIYETSKKMILSGDLESDLRVAWTLVKNPLSEWIPSPTKDQTFRAGVGVVLFLLGPEGSEVELLKSGLVQVQVDQQKSTSVRTDGLRGTSSPLLGWWVRWGMSTPPQRAI